MDPLPVYVCFGAQIPHEPRSRPRGWWNQAPSGMMMGEEWRAGIRPQDSGASLVLKRSGRHRTCSPDGWCQRQFVDVATGKNGSWLISCLAREASRVVCLGWWWGCRLFSLPVTGGSDGRWELHEQICSQFELQSFWISSVICYNSSVTFSITIWNKQNNFYVFIYGIYNSPFSLGLQEDYIEWINTTSRPELKHSINMTHLKVTIT